jgi:hypothetical protein
MQRVRYLNGTLSNDLLAKQKEILFPLILLRKLLNTQSATQDSWLLRQKLYAGSCASKIIPVGEIARRDKWFET